MHIAHHSHLRLPSARTTAISVEVVLGVSAIFGMIYAFGGAPGVGREWLAGSPFHDYLVPGLILGAVVGDSLLLAALAAWLRRPFASLLTRGAGLVLTAWILVQVSIIGVVSVLQPIVLVCGLALLVLAPRMEHDR